MLSLFSLECSTRLWYRSGDQEQQRSPITRYWRVLYDANTPNSFIMTHTVFNMIQRPFRALFVYALYPLPHSLVRHRTAAHSYRREKQFKIIRIWSALCVSASLLEGALRKKEEVRVSGTTKLVLLTGYHQDSSSKSKYYREQDD